MALRAVGDNFYYGFKRDLGAARSTQYKILGYVARELLIKINGEITLRRYNSKISHIVLKLYLIF